MKKLALLLFIALSISACSKPIPEDKLSYAGEWQSKEMYLLILPDGTVSYQRVKDGVRTSIDAPLTEFVGEDFVVGLAFFTTTFDVSEVPHQVDGKWVMVVDGVKLTKNIE